MVYQSAREQISFGFQIHLPTYAGRSFLEITELASAAVDAGVAQLWVTDNPEARSLFVVLAAFAREYPVALGTAVLVQYLRSPLEAATALGAISELLDGRELSVGVGQGNPFTGELLNTPRRIGFMREMIASLTMLLKGEAVHFADFPLLSEYFHFVEGARAQVQFPVPGPVSILGGGNGPKGIRMANELCDGLILGPTLLAADKSGLLARNARLAGVAEPAQCGRLIAEIKISIDESDAEARSFARRRLARKLPAFLASGFTDEDLDRLGVDPPFTRDLAERSRCDIPAVAREIPDDLLDAFFIAGDLERCTDRLRQAQERFGLLGARQLMLSELGADPVSAMKLIAPVMAELRE